MENNHSNNPSQSGDTGQHKDSQLVGNIKINPDFNDLENPETFKNHLQELKDKAKAAGNEFFDEIKPLLLDYTIDVAAPETVLDIGGKPTFTRGNISCISGKAKSRKTFLLALFAAEILKAGGTVLLIDTEQGNYHILKAARRILTLAGLPTDQLNERFRVIPLREKPTDERISVTEKAIKTFHSDITFLDGVRDIVYSINDEHEATETVNLLMRLSTTNGTHICCVLHENKNDTNTRGHLGTEIMNKSETVMSVTKNPQDADLSVVEPKVCRNIEFEPFSFRISNIDGVAVPERCEVPKILTASEQKIIFYKDFFKDKETATFSEVVKYVMNNNFRNDGKNITEGTAKQRVKRAAKENLIYEKNGLYRLSDYFTLKENINEIDEKADELPF